MEEMVGINMDFGFYWKKKVLITGHTGFKGSWLCKVLTLNGAEVIGYALEPPTKPSLFELANISKQMISIFGDVRNGAALMKCVKEYQPEIILHMAAQPIVRESYKNPVYTYETNVMGTVNILETICKNKCVKSFVNVTTDKVYYNNEWEWGYRENDILDGFDPYSNSKSCSELVTATYRRAFFRDSDTAISTCRAGNVIGGGDFAKDRIIPDCVRAMENSEKIIVRNPNSIRPYQHVLEPVCVYLDIARKQYENKQSFEGCYNIGPDDVDCITTGELVNMFCRYWGEESEWVTEAEKNAPHEANYLKLDCSKVKKVLGWHPSWHVNKAVQKTVEWSKAYLAGAKQDAIRRLMDEQIDEYLHK